jgi:hypothetical protein
MRVHVKRLAATLWPHHGPPHQLRIDVLDFVRGRLPCARRLLAVGVSSMSELSSDELSPDDSSLSNEENSSEIAYAFIAAVMMMVIIVSLRDHHCLSHPHSHS